MAVMNHWILKCDSTAAPSLRDRKVTSPPMQQPANTGEGGLCTEAAQRVRAGRPVGTRAQRLLGWAPLGAPHHTHGNLQLPSETTPKSPPHQESQSHHLTLRHPPACTLQPLGTIFSQASTVPSLPC